MALRTVTVRLCAADLSRQMVAIREWIDRNRYGPSRFKYDQDEDAVVVSIDFPKDEEGEAFAKQFELDPENGTVG
jgi:hypothetical protein